jgi:hypothetical protein
MNRWKCPCKLTLIEPLSPLGAWSENYWLAIKSAQAASIQKRHVA